MISLGAGESRVRKRQKKGIHLFSKMSRPAFVPPLFSWYQGVLSRSKEARQSGLPLICTYLRYKEWMKLYSHPYMPSCIGMHFIDYVCVKFVGYKCKVQRLRYVYGYWPTNLIHYVLRCMICFHTKYRTPTYSTSLVIPVTFGTQLDHTNT
jgi:hypothetical protein